MIAPDEFGDFGKALLVGTLETAGLTHTTPLLAHTWEHYRTRGKPIVIPAYGDFSLAMVVRAVT